MMTPKEIEAIAAEQVVFEDGKTLPKVIEAIVERLNAMQGVSSINEEGSETDGI